MPEVIVRHDPVIFLRVGRIFVSRFRDEIRRIVAEELNIPERKDAWLTPDDVIVRFEPHGPDDAGC